MYDTVKYIHSTLAIIVLIALAFAIVDSFIGMSSKRGYTPRNRKIALTALIFAHIQFLVGLILYFVSPFGAKSVGQMSNDVLRLTSLEHPLVVILGLVLITIGWSKHKKLISSELKFKTICTYYSLGLVFIVSRIPWERWVSFFDKL